MNVSELSKVLGKILFSAEEKCKNVKNRVKKSLHQHLNYWEKIDTYDSILSIIRNGYSLPFHSQPPYVEFKNNKSALLNHDFVSEAVQELFVSGRVVQVQVKPYMVNPLSVAENHEKKRLILDLSFLNNFIKKDTVKFEDWKIAIQYFEKDCFMTKFDLQSGYHHIDINPSDQQYLGFSWNNQYFCFTVLPFGLSSAPYIFTKCLRPLVKFWRKNNLKVVLYLDDGLILANSQDRCVFSTEFIKQSLMSAGFFINTKKTIYQPVQEIEWLGLTWRSSNFSLFIPERRISDLEVCLQRVMGLLPYVSARMIAQMTGKIVSMLPVMGNIVRLMTRRCHVAIDKRVSWDKKLDKTALDSIVSEIIFWKRYLRSYNCKYLHNTSKKNVVIYSDASDIAAAAYTVEVNEKVFHCMWDKDEKNKSSTWRELKAIELSLQSFCQCFRGRAVKWLTDNQNCVTILECGSMKMDLHEISISIFETCLRNGITIEAQWVPREENTKADYLSKIIDYEDWGVTDDFFSFISGLWGPYDIDRFASFKNAKVARFNSLFWNPGTEGIDCFSFSWVGVNNWLVPPIASIGKCVSHLIECKACGTIIVPKWPSSYFWTLFFDENHEFKFFVKDALEFNEHQNIFQQNENSKTIFGSRIFSSKVMALRLDASC